MAGRKRSRSLFDTLDPVDKQPTKQQREWWQQQQERTAGHIAKLADAFGRTLKQAEKEGWKNGDERWRRAWLLDARMRYADLTLQLLERRDGRPMACPKCGLKYIETDVDWRTDERIWVRYCEACAMDTTIRVQAEELTERWRE